MTKCCNQNIEIHESKKLNQFWLKCDTCGKKGKGATEKEAEAEFKKSKPEPAQQRAQNQRPAQQTAIIVKPENPLQFQNWSNQNMLTISNQAAQFIDKPLTKRMIEKNTRYVANLTGGSWTDIWSTPEGRDSIIAGFKEANYYGATLGEMGDLVPYGKVCEFIASIECYNFGLTSGNNPPLKKLQILEICKNDIVKKGSRNGNYYCDIDEGSPRGQVIEIVVIAKLYNDEIIGKSYDADRLLQKAREHSQSYRSFLKEYDIFEHKRVEGKLLTDPDSGKEYYIKEIEKKDKTIWKKQIFREDATNPYDGADRIEMLCKMAGKSFARPLMKIRNAGAMAEEWMDDDEPDDITDDRNKTTESVLKKAKNQFNNLPGTFPDNPPDIIDGEYEDVDDISDDDMQDDTDNDDSKEKTKKELFDE